MNGSGAEILVSFAYVCVQLYKRDLMVIVNVRGVGTFSYGHLSEG